MFKEILDEQLLTDCKKAVEVEKKSTARVLEYLSEIDLRRLWQKEGYSSLHDFCVRYLNYSEGEAGRRIHACRLTLKVKEIKPLLEEGLLSLTAVSLLAPHLNNTNKEEILPKVINQPSRQIEKVLDEHFPDRPKKKDFFQAEVDEELRELLTKAQLLASEKDPKKFLKKVLQDYVRQRKTRTSQVKKHTRYVPVSIAREVKKEYGHQCAFTSQKGVRCNQWAHLEVDHIRPWALGGSSIRKENLRPLCKVHNLYMAELNFGRKVPRPVSVASERG